MARGARGRAGAGGVRGVDCAHRSIVESALLLMKKKIIISGASVDNLLISPPAPLPRPLPTAAPPPLDRVVPPPKTKRVPIENRHQIESVGSILRISGWERPTDSPEKKQMDTVRYGWNLVP